jgi:hypothetical protein
MWLSLPIFCSQTKNAWWHRQQNKGADGNKYKNWISKVLKQIHPEVHHFETDSSRMFSGFCISVIRYVLFWDFMQRRMVACYQHFLDEQGVLKRQQQTKTLCCKNPRRVLVTTLPGPTSTVLVSVWPTTLHIRDAQIWKQTTASYTSLPIQHSQIILLWHYTDECHYYQIQVLTALLMKNQVYCDVTPCWLLNSWRSTTPRKPQTSVSLLSHTVHL